jgi:hypothetical protein
MVEMPVRQEDGDRCQPVLGQQVVEPLGDADAGVDHHALLARRGRHDVAVGAEGVGRKSGDEHGFPPGRPTQ